LGRHEDAAKRAQVVQLTEYQAMNMHMNLSIAPLVALLAGILILVMPRLLNYIVALYLIITGLLGLFGGGGAMHLH
jgi:Protein of unknown function (DUF3096)